MKKWLKRIAFGLGAVIVLVVVVAFAATRPFVITRFVVPRAAKTLQTDIRLGDLAFSPFSRLQVEDVRVGPADVPLLQADLARVRYSLLSALAGRIRVNEVRLDDTTVHVLKREDGTTNLPVFPKSTKDDDDDDTHEPQDVRVADLRVSGLNLIYEQRQGPKQGPILLKVSNLSLEVPELASGKEGTLTLGGQVDEFSLGGIRGVKGTLRGDGRLGLDPTLAPSLVALSLRLAFAQGSANAIDLAGREVRLDLEANATADALELRRLAVTELKADHVEASLAISGQVQRQPAEVQLEVIADPIESAVFDIAGALAGDVSFGQPSGTYRARISVQSPERLRRRLERNLEQSWAIAASGRLDLRSLSPRSEAWKLHDLGPFDVSAEHDVTWDTAQKSLAVRALKGRLGSQGRDLLSADLSQPLTVAFAGATPTVQGEAVLALKAHQVPLSLASPFLPPSLPLAPAAGTLEADAEVTVARQGAEVAAVVTSRLADVVLAAVGGQKGVPFSAETRLRATVTDLRRVQAEQLEVAVRPAGADAAEIKATARFDPDAGGEGTVSFSGVRQVLLAIAPDPRLPMLPLDRFSAEGQLRWQAGKGFRPLTVGTQMQVTGVRLRGQEGPDELSTGVTLEAGLSAEEVAIRSGSVSVAIGGQAVLDLSADGALGLTRAASTSRVLSLCSSIVDADRLLAFAKPSLAAPPKAAAAPAAAPAPKTPTPPPPATAPALPPLNGTVSLDLKRIVYNGRSVAVTGTATLAEAAELRALALRLPAGEIAVDGSVRPEGGDWQARLAVSAAGEALVELASWGGRAIPAEPLQGKALAVRFAGAATPDASRVRVEALDVKLAQTGREPLLSVAVTKPLSLTRGKDGALSWTDTDLAVTAAKLPVAMANAVLPASAGVRLDRGELDAALRVALKAEALKADVSGTFALADLAGARGAQAFSAIRIEGAVEGQAAGSDHVSLSRLETTVTAGGAKALALSGTADWDRAKGGSADLRLVADVPVALKAAALGGDQAARVQALTLTLTAKTRLAPENGPITADFTLGADAIRLADARGTALPPWALQVAGKTALGKGQLAIETLTLQAKTPERTLANLALTGAAALLPLEGRSDLRLTGDVLDLTGLLAVAVGSEPEPEKAGKAGKREKAPGAPAEPAQEPGPFNTGNAVADAVVDLRNITYGEVKTDLACTAHLENSLVTVEPLKGTLNGSAFSGSAKANLAVPGLDYAASFTLASLDSGPFLRTFAPKLAPTVQGALSGLSLDIAGQGITRPSLQRSLRGRVDTGAKDIVVQGLPGQAALAQKLSVPEIEKVEVTQVEVKARIQDGKVLLDSVRETAPGHTLGASGVIGLDESLAVDVALGIGGALQARLSQHAAAGYVFRHFTQQGDYMISPAPLPFEGTVRKPKFDKERFLAELSKAGAASLVQGLLEGKLGGKPGVLAAIDDLRKGELTLPGLAAAASELAAEGGGQAAGATAKDDRPRERDRGKAKGAEDTPRDDRPRDRRKAKEAEAPAKYTEPAPPAKALEPAPAKPPRAEAEEKTVPPPPTPAPAAETPPPAATPAVAPAATEPTSPTATEGPASRGTRGDKEAQPTRQRPRRSAPAPGTTDDQGAGATPQAAPATEAAPPAAETVPDSAIPATQEDGETQTEEDAESESATTPADEGTADSTPADVAPTSPAKDRVPAGPGGKQGQKRKGKERRDSAKDSDKDAVAPPPDPK